MAATADGAGTPEVETTETSEHTESFEDHYKALEAAVARLESGDESLSAALVTYEGAIGHLKACHSILAGAEARVRVLTREGERDFEEPSDAGIAG